MELALGLVSFVLLGVVIAFIGNAVSLRDEHRTNAQLRTRVQEAAEAQKEREALEQKVRGLTEQSVSLRQMLQKNIIYDLNESGAKSVIGEMFAPELIVDEYTYTPDATRMLSVTAVAPAFQSAKATIEYAGKAAIRAITRLQKYDIGLLIINIEILMRDAFGVLWRKKILTILLPADTRHAFLWDNVAWDELKELTKIVIMCPVANDRFRVDESVDDRYLSDEQPDYEDDIEDGIESR